MLFFFFSVPRAVARGGSHRRSSAAAIRFSSSFNRNLGQNALVHGPRCPVRRTIARRFRVIEENEILSNISELSE
jgi:hypothetical protein